MNGDFMKQFRAYLPALIASLVVIAGLTLALILLLNREEPAGQGAVAAGVAYLEKLEAKNPASVDAKLEEMRKQKLEAERDALLEQLLGGDKDVWSMFDSYVILGDSRAVGFYYYDFLEKERVLADGGDTIRNIEMHMEEIKALNPSYIYLCYGLNDVSIGYWDTPEEYVAEYMQIIANLKQQVPNATVVVSSILPARDPAFDLASVWREIPTWSAAVEAACEENGILFVNNDATADEHVSLWDPDGIHVRREFYDYWARNLIIAVIEDDIYGE